MIPSKMTINRKMCFVSLRRNLCPGALLNIKENNQLLNAWSTQGGYGESQACVLKKGSSLLPSFSETVDYSLVILCVMPNIHL